MEYMEKCDLKNIYIYGKMHGMMVEYHAFAKKQREANFVGFLQ